MVMTFSGPMFEPKEHNGWYSTIDKEGGHYNLYSCQDEDGMNALRDVFPTGIADEYNFCLFSTSGVHGTYNTIENCMKGVVKGGRDAWGDYSTTVTFLVVHPRLCTIRFGNCMPKNEEDFEYLSRLRSSSWKVVQTIGRSTKG